MTRFKDKCVPVTGGGSGIGPITGRTALGRGSAPPRQPPGVTTPPITPRGFHPRRFTQGVLPRACSVPS